MTSAAELAEAAYPVLLRHGPSRTGSSWNWTLAVLRETIGKWEQEWLPCRGDARLPPEQESEVL